VVFPSRISECLETFGEFGADIRKYKFNNAQLSNCKSKRKTKEASKSKRRTTPVRRIKLSPTQVLDSSAKFSYHKLEQHAAQQPTTNSPHPSGPAQKSLLTPMKIQDEGSVCSTHSLHKRKRQLQFSSLLPPFIYTINYLQYSTQPAPSTVDENTVGPI